jgi:glycosyltransferase involved in cell wall biosynthesis
MNVLHLISSEGHYGAENMMLTLAEATVRRGHHGVIALFLDDRGPHLETAEPARRAGLPVELVPCRGRWDRRTPRRIRELLDRHAAHVLHTHGYKADVYGYCAARDGRAALVATCHNWPDRRLRMRAYAALDRLVLRRFDRVAAASEPVADILRRCGVRADPLPNGVDPRPFREAAPTLRRSLPPDCDRLGGFVGRLVPAKGGEALLQAAQEVIRCRPATAFAFVGDGPCRPVWEARAAALGISRHVLFPGARQDTPAVYASFDFVVLPSETEALPMCLLEAMASNRPVIATRVGSVPRVVIPGVTGLLVEPRNPGALAQAMLRLLRDPELAQRLARQGRAHVARNFSADRMAEAYLRLYAEALSLRRLRRPAA